VVKIKVRTIIIVRTVRIRVNCFSINNILKDSDSKDNNNEDNDRKV
jgi:hypothetical protein